MHKDLGSDKYGVFTRDYQLNVAKSRVLVTVPECLEALALSAANTEWVGGGTGAGASEGRWRGRPLGLGLVHATGTAGAVAHWLGVGAHLQGGGRAHVRRAALAPPRPRRPSRSGSSSWTRCTA